VPGVDCALTAPDRFYDLSHALSCAAASAPVTGRAAVAGVEGGPWAQSRAWRGTLLAAVVVGVGYYLGARLGLGLSLVEHNVTPLWPPTGIALAGFLLFGRRIWPAVALAAFAANLPIHTGVLPAVVTAVGNTAAPLVAAFLLERLGFRRQLDRGRDAMLLVFPAALGSMLISATVGTATLVASGVIDASRWLSAGAVWWTGDAMGVLAVAPFLLSLTLYRGATDWSPRRWVETAAVLVVVVAVSAWVVSDDLPILFVLLLVLGLAAWRLQARGAAPAALLASLAATWAATHDRGPFSGNTLVEQMITLQAFNSGVAITSFCLAALVSERRRTAAALVAAATELEARVEQRTADLVTANSRLLQEIQGRSEAQEQLSREESRSRREHQIAETLQRSLLPDQLPVISGVDLAARYVPATADVHVGGDWYDVVHLPGGLIGLAIGDVAGHGLQAAATMGQLRMALRAYALHDSSPTAVLHGLHQLVAQLPMPEMATLAYLLLDPESGSLRYANAGHPPPAVVENGGVRFLEEALSPPVGVTADGQLEGSYPEAGTVLAPGSTLLLYTDGLVERRGVSIQDGLDRLEVQAHALADAELDALCDGVLAALVDGYANADDIALLALRTARAFDGPLDLSVPARPPSLVHVRRTLRRWLRETGASSQLTSELIAACGEACANVVQHAYEGEPGSLRVVASLTDGVVVLEVSDQGRWRPGAERGGGWGMQLIEALTDGVDVATGPTGTTVSMTRRLTTDEGGAS
jgi:serine phosphatase RsbU (regulator of sigma subunit)/anti-sigma regulatory factor (Ser/Thr protein kinase)